MNGHIEKSLMGVTHVVIALFGVGVADAETSRSPARGPRVIVHAVGSIETEGLPAISGDSATIAVSRSLGGGEDLGHVVEFRRVADLHVIETFVLYERRGDGRVIPFPRDGFGETLWVRGQTLNERLAREGYRALESIGEPHYQDAQEMVEGAGLRILQALQTGRYTIREASGGRVLARGQLETMRIYCVDEESTVSDIRPAIVAAWRDRRARLILFDTGNPYLSILCPSETSLVAVRLPR